MAVDKREGAQQSVEVQERISDHIRVFHRELPVWTPHFKEMQTGYEYLAGNHYEEPQKEWYKSLRRPTRVFNLIFPLFNQVLGDFLLNDQKMKVYAKPGGTNEIAALFEDQLDHINTQSDYKSMLADGMLSGLVKVGYFFPRFSNETTIQGSIQIGVVDEFEIMFDSRCSNYFLDDAEYIIRSKWMRPEQIYHLWPNHRSQLENFIGDLKNLESNFVWDNTTVTDPFLNVDFINEKEGRYRVIEFHHLVSEMTEVAFDVETGDSTIYPSLTPKKQKLFQLVNPNTKIIQRQDWIKRVTTFIPGLFFQLDHVKSDIQDRSHDIIPFFSYHYGIRTINNMGMFKNAKDPQDDFNSWKNQSNTIINKTVDPGWIYKPDALQNPAEVELYGSMPGFSPKVNYEYDLDQAIQLNQTPVLPFGPDQMALEAADFLQKVTGVTPNIMGQTQTKQENASLFAQRVRQARTALSVITHNFSRSKVRIYNKVILLMQENYTIDHFWQISKPDEDRADEMIRAMNDFKVGRYEIFPDDQERNPNAKAVRFMQKSEVVNIVLQMFPQGSIDPNLIVQIMAWWLDESDLGDIDKLIQAFVQSTQGQTDAALQADASGQLQSLFALAQQKIDLNSSGTEENANAIQKQAS